MTIVSTEINKNIAVITIDNPPVNALSHAVRSGVSVALKQVSSDQDVAAIIIICAGRTFCAGADITEFGKPPMDPSLPDLIAEMDQVNKPLIAALHGTALGGGFEVALGCHYRIMDSHAKVGLPEVNLGLIPGAGGTQRLPRLIGVEAALDMIVTGKPISAAKAEKLGIANKISHDDLKSDALEFTQDLLTQNKPVMRISDLDVKASTEVFSDFEKKVSRRIRGFIAPKAAINAVKEATELSFEEGLIYERDQFKILVNSSHSIAQRHMFFAERMALKVPGIDKSTSVREMNSVAVIGGGIMGCGIAINFLNKGLPVTLIEISEEAQKAAFERIANIYSSSVSKGRLSEQQKEQTLSLLITASDYAKLANADLIIEAVFEDIEIKKQVFKKLDDAAKTGAILATNTSFLDINEIANVTSRPADVIGLHFFSPAHIMPLLEIVRTEQTSTEVLATVLKIGKLIGKTSVVSGVCFGFIANRMSSCYGREAGLLLLEGASVEQIDNALYDFGMPMGMFSMLDMAGIDIGVMARQNMAAGSYDEKAFLIHDALVASGQKGQKTGSGFYKHEGRNKSPNPQIEQLVEKFAKENNIKRREITIKEIEERCIFALINEGFKIVEEGIAIRQSDVDVVFSCGFGFPRYKGGPLHYAEQIGFDYTLKRITEFAKEHGDRWWTPSDLLIKLAKENR